MRDRASSKPRASTLLLAAAVAVGCGGRDARDPGAGAAGDPAAARGTVDATARTVTLSAATVAIGTRPGTAGRDANVEADGVPTSIPEVVIDVGLYPNRPGTAPRAGASREEAERLCRAEDKHLCDELEWERACRSGTSALRDMGRMREWTSGAPTRFTDTRAGVVRGGEDGTDRCGVRRARATSDASGDVGFRCCAGDAPELAYPTERTRPAFEDVPMSTTDARAALAGVPELERFASSFTPFAEADVAQVFVRGGVPPEAIGVRRVVRGALRFTPRPFDEALVLAGRASGSSVIAVLYPTGEGYVHGASMILNDDPVSVLLWYAASNTTTVGWTTCFDCPGEGGTIELRDDGRIVVVQR